MKKIEVLGTGCKKCVTTENLISEVAKDLQLEVDIVKVDNPIDIASRGIMSTPAVMVDGNLVFKGGVPDREEVSLWLKD